MGGGAMLPYVGKVVGLDGRRAAAPPHRAYGRCESSTAESSAFRDQEFSDQYLDSDEWEFAGYEDPHCPERVVFWSVPTEQEAEEAASDLQDALSQVVYPFPSSQACKTASSPNLVQQSPNLHEGSTSSESENTTNENTVDRVEPELHPYNCETIQQLGQNNVFDAFQLLQTDPLVQGAVISLASDKAVWDAVLNNERVLEFRQSLQKGNSKLQDITGDSDEVSVGKPNVFFWAVKNAKMKLMDYMEKITEISSAILEFVDKRIFAEKDGDVLDRTLKSSLLLSIMVLLVVVVKRALIF